MIVAKGEKMRGGCVRYVGKASAIDHLLGFMNEFIFCISYKSQLEFILEIVLCDIGLFFELNFTRLIYFNKCNLSYPLRLTNDSSFDNAFGLCIFYLFLLSRAASVKSIRRNNNNRKRFEKSSRWSLAAAKENQKPHRCKSRRSLRTRYVLRCILLLLHAILCRMHDSLVVGSRLVVAAAAHSIAARSFVGGFFPAVRVRSFRFIIAWRVRFFGELCARAATWQLRMLALVG